MQSDFLTIDGQRAAYTASRGDGLALPGDYLAGRRG